MQTELPSVPFPDIWESVAWQGANHNSDHSATTLESVAWQGAWLGLGLPCAWCCLHGADVLQHSAVWCIVGSEAFDCSWREWIRHVL